MVIVLLNKSDNETLITFLYSLAKSVEFKECTYIQMKLLSLSIGKKEWDVFETHLREICKGERRKAWYWLSYWELFLHIKWSNEMLYFLLTIKHLLAHENAFF